MPATSAIYIRHDSAHGYGHVYAYIGCIDTEERRPCFKYVTAEANRTYGDGWSFVLSCQIGSGTDMAQSADHREPYAIRVGIDPRGYSDSVEIDRMPALAKHAAKLRRDLDRVAARIGTPATFEDHAIALFLATKPALLVTRKASHWDASDEYADATADSVRQAIRRAVNAVKRELGYVTDAAA